MQDSANVNVTTDSKHQSLVKYFGFKHLPEHLQPISEKFHDMATWLDSALTNGPEKTVCMRKLLEAKDCAVRANLDTK